MVGAAEEEGVKPSTGSEVKIGGGGGEGVGHGKYASWEAAASHPGLVTCQRTEALSQSQGVQGSPKKEAGAAGAAAAVAEVAYEAERGNL